MLQGKLPNGEQLGKMVNGEMKHRPGWDLTLSVPKSVSIMIYVGGDTRLEKIEREALFATLSHIERSCSQARIKIGDKITYQNTGNMVAALYYHDLSRANDPQKHTHCVVMNMTERPDKKWRSQASQIGRYDQHAKGEINGFIERVDHHRRYFSKIYETELAYRVKQLGYEITTDTKSGKFEIVGISQEVLDFFSKRRLEIEKHLKQKGLSGGEAANIAALATRDAKENVDRAKLKEEWDYHAKRLGLDCQKIIENTYNKEQTESFVSDVKTMEAIKHAAKSLSVFQTTFTLEEIVTEAADYAIRHSVTFKSLLDATNAEILSGELISLPNDSGKTLLMAKSTLKDEKKLFTHLADKKKLVAPIDIFHLMSYLREHAEIKEECHDHLKTIFNNDRIVFLEGEVTRQELIEPVMKIANASHLEVAILSPSLVGSKTFAKKVKPVPETFWERIKSVFVDNTPKHYSVMQLLSSSEDESAANNKRPDILIVDNAHLLSTHQKANLVELNVQHNTKLILLGEKHTLLPQQRGTRIDELTTHGVQTISIQKTQHGMIQDENSIFHSAVTKMMGRINEVKNADDRFHAMASHYVRLNESDRRKSWLMAHKKQSIEDLNQLAHQTLKDKQKLGKAITIKVLVPLFLPEGKSLLASAYQKEQVVRFNETYSSLGVERGEYLRVIKTNKTTNRVLLQKENGKHVLWQPDKIAGGHSGKVELFNEKTRELCVGESVLFHRSIKAREIVKGERAKVTNIRHKTLKLENSNGKSITLDLEKPYHRHIDYGYATTPHAIAHERPHLLIAELPAKTFHTDQRRFYQIISQPKEAFVYTDDHKGLVAHLEKKTGDRLSAHDMLAKADDIKKNLHSLYDVLEKQIAKQNGIENSSTLSRVAVEAVEYAMHHLAEREAGFTHKQLMHTAMDHALGKVTHETLNHAAIAMEKAGILRGDGTLWTTADAVKIEREIIALVTKDKGKLEPIANDELLAKYCDPNKLESEQIDAVKAITQSKDRVLAIQGHPGTGKTTMFATVVDVLAAKELLTAQGYEIVGLAPTHVAVKELTSRGIQAQTLDSFIGTMKKELALAQPIKRSNLIIVIDEASMVSNRRMLEVLQITHQLDCRAIPAGDTRQLPSPEAGKPHDLIQNTEVETKHLVKIRRQENDVLKQAVKETIGYDFKAAFTTLKNSIIEISVQPQKKDAERSWEERCQENRIERVCRLVNDYLSYAKDQRDNIQVITPGHDDRVLANSQIREQLKEEGTLVKNNDQSFRILTAESMTQVERSHITNLSIGDVLRFAKREGSLIKAGSYLTIMEINKDYSLIKLKNEDEREVAWQVPKFDKKRLSSIEVFKKETRNLQVGDIVRWTKSDKENALFSSEAAKVTGIAKNHITVELANKKSLTFDANHARFQHWDHGYAATVYAVQGKTKDIVLVHLESFRENLTTQPAFLVALTRSVNEFRLYTDNTSRLLKTIEKNTGVKLSSLEVIGDYPSKLVKAHKEKEFKPTLANTIIATEMKHENGKRNKTKDINKPPYFNRHTVQRIKEGLNEAAEKIAIDFLGTPKETGSNYLKFGNNQGSLSVTIKGEKQGWFNDFDTNQGGRDMLKFIQVYGGMNREEALKYGANWLGILPNKDIKPGKIHSYGGLKKPDLSKEVSGSLFSDYEKKRIKLANQLANESVAVKGTLAEKYLEKYRGIDIENVPDDIRFHPKIHCQKNNKALPALLAIARDAKGEIQSVEAIYLDPKTADRADVPLKKQTIGSKKGASVMIKQTNDPNAPTLVAEGTVTGLSVAQALPNVNVNITLGKGMFAHLDSVKLSNKIIFCLDNDGKNLKSDKVILAASTRLVSDKKEVSFMIPNGLSLPKQDYNDILKQKGCDAIKRDFQQAIPYADFYSQDTNYPIKINDDQDKLPSKKIIREVMRNEKEISPSLVKSINHQPVLQKISEEMISNFAKDASREASHFIKTHSSAYKQIQKIQSDISEKEIIKPINIHKDIEREI